MKLAFSTLGCPEFGWSDVYSMAKDLGFQGIEVRGLGDELFDGKTKPFQQENLPKTLAQLKKIRMNISCISSGACLKFPEKAEETRRKASRKSPPVGAPPPGTFHRNTWFFPMAMIWYATSS